MLAKTLPSPSKRDPFRAGQNKHTSYTTLRRNRTTKHINAPSTPPRLEIRAKAVTSCFCIKNEGFGVILIGKISLRAPVVAVVVVWSLADVNIRKAKTQQRFTLPLWLVCRWGKVPQVKPVWKTTVPRPTKLHWRGFRFRNSSCVERRTRFGQRLFVSFLWSLGWANLCWPTSLSWVHTWVF